VTALHLCTLHSLTALTSLLGTQWAHTTSLCTLHLTTSWNRWRTHSPARGGDQMETRLTPAHSALRISHARTRAALLHCTHLFCRCTHRMGFLSRHLLRTHLLPLPLLCLHRLSHCSRSARLCAFALHLRRPALCVHCTLRHSHIASPCAPSNQQACAQLIA